NALMNPIFVPMFPSLVLTVLWSISGPMSLGNFAHKALTTDVLLSGNTWRAQQIDVHHPTGFGLGTPARGGNIVAHGIDFPGYKFFMLGADIGAPPDMPLAEAVEDGQGAGQHDHKIHVVSVAG